MTEDMTVHERAALAVAEILQDMREGRIPTSVRTFSELHDYVDANEYGGTVADDLTVSEVVDLQDRVSAAMSTAAWQRDVLDVVDYFRGRIADALRGVGLDCHVIGTGGGCEALSVRVGDREVLVTDADDALIQTGGPYAVGLYEYDEIGERFPVEEPLLSSPVRGATIPVWEFADNAEEVAEVVAGMLGKGEAR